VKRDVVLVVASAAVLLLAATPVDMFATFIVML